MRSMILQLDGSLERQTELQRAALQGGGRILAARDLGPALRLWSTAQTLADLRQRLKTCPPEPQAEVVFAGSGDFHHVTPLLIERAVAAYGGPITVLHFDNHPDWVRQAQGRHCGSWVGRAARMEGVARVITIGVCSPDVGRGRARQGDLALLAEDKLELYAWAAPDGGEAVVLEGRAWPTIASMGEATFLDRLDAAITTSGVYVTVDKDVLRPQDAVTNWDQGQASLDFVIAAIRRASAGRRVIGADVVGDWSQAAYGAGPAAWLLKRGEALLDQPWGRPEPEAARAVNEAANLRLLDLFAELS
ncbi:arginase [Phenylobacterium hankyongense]|uniref:Arginase n=1 Tax=Phenylobacterium hankyongense TaxID=1813876 RepID=A0A328B075_9CAUL|nr:arginase family protein [Phenylobacterium hankyongense]RAK58428.1 arginase [Phenylobacterium hankyongense]